MSQYNLISTVHKPTAVTKCVSGEFIKKGVTSLITVQTSRICITNIEDEGSVVIYDGELYGTVTMIELFVVKKQRSCCLFLAFEKYCCVVVWDPKKETIRTLSQRQLLDRRTQVEAPLCALDRQFNIVAFHLELGSIDVLRISDDGTLGQFEKLKVDEPHFHSICFVDPLVFRDSASSRDSQSSKSHRQISPTIACLFTDGKKVMHVKTYVIDIATRRVPIISRGEFSQQHLEITAQILMRVPEGLLVVGNQLVAFISPKKKSAIDIQYGDNAWESEDESGRNCEVGGINIESTCYCSGSMDEVLISDSNAGRLFRLRLKVGGDQKPNLNLQYLGKTSRSACMTHLGIRSDNMVFIGSSTGNSMLIKIVGGDSKSGPTLEVLDTHTNLGPIANFCLLGSQSGADQMIACSGSNRDGSIRVIRNGIGVTELASLPISGVQGIWSLSGQNESVEVVVLSFVGSTKVLQMTDDRVEEIAIPSFSLSEATLLCSDVWSSDKNSLLWVQVTATGAYLALPMLSASSASQCSVFRSSKETITVAAVSKSRIVLACAEKLTLLEVKGNVLVEKQTRILKSQVSCLCITKDEKYCVVGQWTANTVSILSLDGLTDILTEKATGDLLPRSVLVHNFSGTNNLLCGLGDGSIAIWEISESKGTISLKDKKIVPFGLQPVTLRVIETVTQNSSRGHPVRQSVVFACSDKPAVLFSQSGRLQLSPINLKNVAGVCLFNTTALGEANNLALVTDGNFMIGSIDGIQKLHVRTVPMRRTVCEITYHKASNHFACIVDASPTEPPQVLLLNEHSFEPSSLFSLDSDEVASSIMSTTLLDDPEEYIIVGTGYVDDIKIQSSNGRILIFKVQGSQLVLTAEKEVKGLVLKLLPFHGKLLCGVNGTIQLWRWQEGAGGKMDLTQECYHGCRLAVVSLEVSGDLILAGYLFHSVQVFQYRSIDSSFEELWVDRLREISAATFLNDETFLVADEKTRDLFVLSTDGHGKKLRVAGGIFLNHVVRSFTKGSLTHPLQTLPDPQTLPSEALDYARTTTMKLDVARGIVFGTQAGFIGTVVSLSQAQFTFLQMLQESIAEVWFYLIIY